MNFFFFGKVTVLCHNCVSEKKNIEVRFLRKMRQTLMKYDGDDFRKEKQTPTNISRAEALRQKSIFSKLPACVL